MNYGNWLTLIGILATAVVSLVLAFRKTIESLIGKRLDDLQDGINDLRAKSDDHSGRITRVETILDMNGCSDGARCERRKVPRD